MNGLRTATLTLRFISELGMHAGLSYCGFTMVDGSPGIALGVGAPLLSVAIWWMFIAPKAFRAVDISTRLILEIVLFATAASALASAGHPTAGTALGLIALTTSLLNTAHERRSQRKLAW